jgi:two-component SAPR family response regulator
MTRPSPSRPLADKHVLIVEDQYLIADEMRRAVVALGGAVVGPCASLDAAERTTSEQAIDFAILDVNIQGREVFSLAEELQRRSIPFIFATGYDDWVMPEGFRRHHRLQKPVTARTLRAAVVRNM